MIEKTCVYCGKPVIIKKNSDYRLKKNGWKFFCSRECSFKYHTGDNSTLAKRPLVYTTKTCPVCGKIFDTIKYKGIKCCCKEHGKLLMQKTKFCETNGINCNISYNEYVAKREEIEKERKAKKNRYRSSNIGIKYSDNKKEYMKEYHRLHREEIYELKRNRLKNNPLIKMKDDIRKAINRSIKKGKYVGGRFDLRNIIGCSMEDLLLHLSSKFKEGMTFDNYGKWHIDHIVPLFLAMNEGDVLDLCNYNNLQPLWAYENNSKGRKVI